MVRIDPISSHYHNFPVGPSQQQKDDMKSLIGYLDNYLEQGDYNKAQGYYDQIGKSIDTWKQQGLITPKLAEDMHTQLDTYYQQSIPWGDQTQAHQALTNLVNDINNA